MTRSAPGPFPSLLPNERVRYNGPVARLAFKPDSSFFKKIAIGAVGTRHVSALGQSLMLTNKFSNEELKCSVVFLDPEKGAVGVEFMRPASDFWSVCFPLPRARELP